MRRPMNSCGEAMRLAAMNSRGEAMRLAVMDSRGKAMRLAAMDSRGNAIRLAAMDSRGRCDAARGHEFPRRSDTARESLRLSEKNGKKIPPPLRGYIPYSFFFVNPSVPSFLFQPFRFFMAFRRFPWQCFFRADRLSTVPVCHGFLRLFHLFDRITSLRSSSHR